MEKSKEKEDLKAERERERERERGVREERELESYVVIFR